MKVLSAIKRHSKDIGNLSETGFSKRGDLHLNQMYCCQRIPFLHTLASNSLKCDVVEKEHFVLVLC